jgi:hypothetical protein
MQPACEQLRYRFIGYWIRLVGKQYPAAAKKQSKLFLRIAKDSNLDSLPERDSGPHEAIALTVERANVDTDTLLSI